MRHAFIPWGCSCKLSLEKWSEWHTQWDTGEGNGTPLPVLLPGKSHGWRGLVGCSPRGHWELDTTKKLHFHFLLSCIGEGNVNPLQCCCLENPRDRGAWWAAVYRVAQSRTRLRRLSSSSSSISGQQSCSYSCFFPLLLSKSPFTERVCHQHLNVTTFAISTGYLFFFNNRICHPVFIFFYT